MSERGFLLQRSCEDDHQSLSLSAIWFFTGKYKASELTLRIQVLSFGLLLARTSMLAWRPRTARLYKPRYDYAHRRRQLISCRPRALSYWCPSSRNRSHLSKQPARWSSSVLATTNNCVEPTDGSCAQEGKLPWCRFNTAFPTRAHDGLCFGLGALPGLRWLAAYLGSASALRQATHLTAPKSDIYRCVIMSQSADGGSPASVPMYVSYGWTLKANWKAHVLNALVLGESLRRAH